MKRMHRLLRKETRKLLSAFLSPTFIYVTIMGNLFLLLTVTIVYYLEKDINPNMTTYFDYLWWGVSTITTVGYGDGVPITVAGRIIAIGLMYTGTVLFVTFTGILLTFLMKEEVEEIEHEEKEIESRLDRLEKK